MVTFHFVNPHLLFHYPIVNPFLGILILLRTKILRLFLLLQNHFHFQM